MPQDNQMTMARGAAKIRLCEVPPGKPALDNGAYDGAKGVDG
jgi:hypothetical protein